MGNESTAWRGANLHFRAFDRNTLDVAAWALLHMTWASSRSFIQELHTRAQLAARRPARRATTHLGFVRRARQRCGLLLLYAIGTRSAVLIMIVS